MISLPAKTREQSFSNHDSRIANQTSQQTIHGGQHIYLCAAPFTICSWHKLTTS